jgi:hypothetical protein
MAVTRSGNYQALRRIIQHSYKFDRPLCNNLPNGMSVKEAIKTLEAIKKSCDKSLEFYRTNK